MATTTIEREIEEAKAAARAAAEEGPTDRFLERMVERIGGQARIEAVFGEPIKRGDLTIVPVARIRWGFGGGSGSALGGPDEAAVGSGSGGGGGMTADPLGYLEIGPSGATFQPIVARFPSPAFILASGITAALVLRALARFVR
jgi:uncharacterized spore protein YtfJ